MGEDGGNPRRWHGASTSTDPGALWGVGAADADTMAGLLSHLDERHDGAASYLRVNGLSDSELHRLAGRLVTSV